MKNILNTLPTQDYKNNNRLVASGVSRRVFEFIAYTTGDTPRNPYEGHFVLKRVDVAVATKPVPAHRSPTLTNR